MSVHQRATTPHVIGAKCARSRNISAISGMAISNPWDQPPTRSRRHLWTENDGNTFRRIGQIGALLTPQKLACEI
jgi:hypothetical protein